MHIAPFIFGTCVVMFLFLFQFLFNNIDQLVGKGLSEWVIIQLIVYNLSWMVVLAVPMGVLFSTLMTFGNMSSAYEVMIIKTSGGNLIGMMKPLLLAGVFLTVFLFWFNDYVLPEANHRAKVLMMDIKRKKPTFSIKPGQFSQQLEGYTILARRVDSLTGAMEDVTIYDTRRGDEINVVSADTGIANFSPGMSKLILDLYDGEIHKIEVNHLEDYRKVDFEKYRILIGARGFALKRTDEAAISRGDREMRIKDMEKIVESAREKQREFAQKIRNKIKSHYNYLIGADTSAVMEATKDTTELETLQNVKKRLSFLRSNLSAEIMRKEDYEKRERQYLVEIHKKYAIPFACIVFILVGCPLGIMTKRGNFGVSASISIGFYIFYWACLIGGEKLADRGFMHPVFSMWLGNILTSIMGIILVTKVNNESLRVPGKRFFSKFFRAKNH